MSDTHDMKPSLSAQSAKPQTGEALPKDTRRFKSLSTVDDDVASPQSANPAQVTERAILALKLRQIPTTNIGDAAVIGEAADALAAIGAGGQAVAVPEGRWVYTSACAKFEGHTNRVRAYAGSIHAGWENSPEFESAEAFYEWAKAECDRRNTYEAKCRAALSQLRPADERVVEALPQAMREQEIRWAVGRWRAEVENRPLVNIHRRSLDDSWRQVIRHFGGDPEALCGPAHDELLELSAKEGRS